MDILLYLFLHSVVDSELVAVIFSISPIRLWSAIKRRSLPIGFDAPS